MTNRMNTKPNDLEYSTNFNWYQIVLIKCCSCSDYQDWIKWRKYDGSSFHKSLSLASVSIFTVKQFDNLVL